MPNEFWKKMMAFPKDPSPSKGVRYPSRKRCDKVACDNGFEISWDFYGKGMHRVSPDLYGEGIAYSTIEVMERII